jgi:ribosomal protein L7/L12
MPEQIIAWMGGLTLGLLVAAFLLLAKVAAATARVDRKLDALLRHSGVDLVGLANTEVQALLKAGRKIDAIKAYRDLTGAGLAEAKAAVERMG